MQIHGLHCKVAEYANLILKSTQGNNFYDKQNIKYENSLRLDPHMYDQHIGKVV